MKKALSFLLALALMLGCAVCAFAAKETAAEPGASRFQEFIPELDAIVQSLTFELPAVTGITAVWDGETGGLFDRWYGPRFSPENVAVTVSFEEGGPEVLTSWYSYGNGWWWEIGYNYAAATGTVTFYYEDSNLRQAYHDTLSDDEEWIWEDLLSMLPQSTFTIPANLRTDYLNSLAKTELKLGENKKAVLTDREMKMFTFTPEKAGLYYFYSENLKANDYATAVLMNDSFDIVMRASRFFDRNFDILAELQPGKTYHLIVSGYGSDSGDAADFDVGVRDDVRKLTDREFVVEALFGWMLGRRVLVDFESYYTFPGADTPMGLLRTYTGYFRDNFWYALVSVLIDFLDTIRWSLL